MVDSLKHIREPAAWIVVVVTAASIVLALVRFVLALTTGATLPSAAQDVALTAMNLTLVVLVVGLVGTCVFVDPPTRSAPRLVVAAALVVTLGTLLTLVGALVGLSASAGAFALVLEFLGGLLDIILKGVATVVLWLTHAGLRAGRISRAPADAVSGGSDGLAGQAVDSGPAVPAPPAPPPPAWTTGTAAGSAWITAADAAQGAPASGVGVPGSGSASGWRPVARPAAGGAPEGPSQGEGSVVEPVDGPPPSGPVPGSWFREARGAASEDGAD